jgi:hypothetical protein
MALGADFGASTGASFDLWKLSASVIVDSSWFNNMVKNNIRSGDRNRS